MAEPHVDHCFAARRVINGLHNLDLVHLALRLEKVNFSQLSAKMISHPKPSQHVRLSHYEQVLTAVGVVAANLSFELSLTGFEVARLN
jgi:hypothetical protein